MKKAKSPAYAEHVSVAKFAKEDHKVYQRRTNGSLLKRKDKYHLIDLFSGAGGMTLGFSKHFGHLFEPIWANDFDAACVRTYNANFGNHCVSGDINEIVNLRGFRVPTADVVIGGPPCQGFSLLNKNREGDPRKQLWRPFLDVVKRSGATVFVMENVPQLIKSYEHGEIMGLAQDMGFNVWGDILCAADFGVSQTRRRAFIIGSKKIDPRLLMPPRKTHYDPRKFSFSPMSLDDSTSEYLPSAQRWRTVRDAIADLPDPQGIEIREEPPPLDLHFGRTPTSKSMARYRAIPKEGMNRVDLLKRAPELTPPCWIKKKSGGTDLFGRMWWDRPSFTIRTEFFKPEKGRYLHPLQHRPITHREAARLQSFPDDFTFTGTKIEVARQIGNAVPPLLAARVADVVYLLLTQA
jgi:DNA (cytosine-5)-methyltransferase 1